MKKYLSYLVMVVVLLMATASAYATAPRYKTYGINKKVFLDYRAKKAEEEKNKPKPVEVAPPEIKQVAPPAPVRTTPSSHILQLVNQVRAANGVAPLEERYDLSVSAGRSVQNMIAGHFCCSHGNWQQWFAGLPYMTYGENIGACAKSDEEMVDVWVHSPPHFANIIDPSYHYGGVSKSVGTFVGDYSNGQPMDCVYYANHFGG